MSDLTAVNGTVIHIDDDSVTRVSGPYAHDPADRAYVAGPQPAPIPVKGDAAAIVAGLSPSTPLAQLTRPDDKPVWLKGSAVSAVRKSLPGDAGIGETVGAVLTVAGEHQAVIEDVALARKIINAHGGHI